MSAHVETMAYEKSEMPWHRFGNPVSNDMTVEAMQEAAGLNWTVSKRPLYFPKFVAEGERPQLRVVPNEFAIVRDSDESVLDTCGDKWKPVQNHEIFDFFKRFVEAGDMRMETAGSLKGGRYIWALARMNEEFQLAKGDKTIGYMLLSQPHRFGVSMVAALTPIRVVCWNTISYALGSDLSGKKGQNTASFRMPHSRAFNDEVKASAEQALGLAHEGMKAYTHTAELLSNSTARNDDVMDYFHTVLQLEQDEEGESEDDLNRNVKRMQEALTQAPGQDLNKGTWWSAFNAVTYCADHQMGRTDENRLTSAWFGVAASMKRRALDTAVEYAKAA